MASVKDCEVIIPSSCSAPLLDTKKYYANFIMRKLYSSSKRKNLNCMCNPKLEHILVLLVFLNRTSTTDHVTYHSATGESLFVNSNKLIQRNYGCWGSSHSAKPCRARLPVQQELSTNEVSTVGTLRHHHKPRYCIFYGKDCTQMYSLYIFCQLLAMYLLLLLNSVEFSCYYFIFI